MIQRMNNVLIKHSKILFGVITVVIIISFVWFFTPGADGSLLFSRNSNVIARIGGKTDVTVGDAQRAQRARMLAVAPAIYEQFGADAADYIARMGGGDREELQTLAVIMKLADLQGFSASDNEVKAKIKAEAAFQGNGKFSAAKYNQFISAIVEKLGYTVEDFETALRDMIQLEKFQNSAFAGVTAPAPAVVEEDIKTVLYKVTGREITFKADDFMAGIPEVSEADLKKEYESDPKRFMSVPVSDAAIFYLNYKDVKSADLEKRVDDRYALFGKNMKTADGKEMAEKEAKDLLRKSIVNEDATTQLGEVISDAGAEPTADSIRVAAAKKGIKLQSADLNDVTVDTAASAIADKSLILAICAINKVNTLSRVVPNKDSVAVALLTKRTEACQLDFAAAKKAVSDLIRKKAASAKAKEAADAFRAELATGKIKAENMAEAAKKAGGSAAEEQVTDIPAALKGFVGRVVTQLNEAIAKNDIQTLAQLVQFYDRFINGIKPEVGYMTPVMNDPESGISSFACVTKAEAVPADAELLQIHLVYLTAAKKIAAMERWGRRIQIEVLNAINAVQANQ